MGRKKGVKTLVLTNRKVRETNSVDLELLQAQINEAADRLRELKSSLTTDQVTDEIFRLLEMKYLHPDLRHFCYTVDLNPNSLPPKLFKVRWTVIDENGEERRLQRPFQDRTSLSGHEIINAITAMTHKKYPHLCGPLKFEVLDSPTSTSASASTSTSTSRASSDRASRKAYRVLLPSDRVKLDLINPGPRLSDVKIVDVRVTFPAKPSHATTPAVYDQLPVIPAIIDAGVNLFDEAFDRDGRKALTRAFGAGVCELVLISTTVASSLKNLEYCSAHRGSMYAVVGVHPYDAGDPLGQYKKRGFKLKASKAAKVIEEAAGSSATGASASASVGGQSDTATSQGGGRGGKRGGRKARDSRGGKKAKGAAPGASPSAGPTVAPLVSTASVTGKEEATAAGPSAPPPTTDSSSLLTAVGDEGDRARWAVPPHSADDSAALTALREVLSRPRGTLEAVVGLGECGLDYTCFHNMSEEEVAVAKGRQMYWFKAQLDLAVEFGLPVFVHERHAFADTLDVLTEYRSRLTTILVNCFTGNEQELKAYLSLDCFIGVTGILSDALRGSHLPALVASIPSNRLIISTDAPYLLPFNMGKPFPKRNEPAFLPHVLVKVAEVRQESIEAVAYNTRTNTTVLFPTLNCSASQGVVYPTSTFGRSVRAMVAANASLVDANEGGQSGGKDEAAVPSVLVARLPLSELDADGLVTRLAEQGIRPRPASGFVYVNGTVYHASFKELAILKNQKLVLAEDAYVRLAADFMLEPVVGFQAN